MTELISRIDQSRFDLRVACFRREGHWLSRVEAAAPVTQFAITSFRSPSTWRTALRFARWCRTNHIAVAHACDFYANVFALPAAALARVPLRIGSRRDIRIPLRSPAQHRLQALSYRFAHRVIANSRAAAAQLAREGVPLEVATVIPNGIELDRYAAAPLRVRRRTITTVANLRGEKGHDVLIAAAARVLREVPDAVFQLAGDGPLRDTLEAQARALGIAPQVRFLGHCEDVVGLLRASDLFVLPSRTEAFPNAVMEAMAARLPVVATDVGGIPELVEHDRTGLLVPVADEQALARAIVALLRDADRADRLASAARARIEARYSFDRMVAAFEALYRGELSNTLPIDGAAEPLANVFPRA